MIEDKYNFLLIGLVTGFTFWYFYFHIRWGNYKQYQKEVKRNAKI